MLGPDSSSVPLQSSDLRIYETRIFAKCGQFSPFDHSPSSNGEPIKASLSGQLLVVGRMPHGIKLPGSFKRASPALVGPKGSPALRTGFTFRVVGEATGPRNESRGAYATTTLAPLMKRIRLRKLTLGSSNMSASGMNAICSPGSRQSSEVLIDKPREPRVLAIETSSNKPRAHPQARLPELIWLTKVGKARCGGCFFPMHFLHFSSLISSLTTQNEPVQATPSLRHSMIGTPARVASLLESVCSWRMQSVCSSRD